MEQKTLAGNWQNRRSRNVCSTEYESRGLWTRTWTRSSLVSFHHLSHSALSSSRLSWPCHSPVAATLSPFPFHHNSTFFLCPPISSFAFHGRPRCQRGVAWWTCQRGGRGRPNLCSPPSPLPPSILTGLLAHRCCIATVLARAGGVGAMCRKRAPLTARGAQKERKARRRHGRDNGLAAMG